MTTIKAKTIIDTIEKYNKRVARKIGDIKEENTELLEKRRRFEELFDNDTYMGGLGADPIAHRRYLLEVISYYQLMKVQLVDAIEMKKRVNDNPGKIAVLKRLLNMSKDSTVGGSSTTMVPLSKTDSESLQKAPFEIGATSTDEPTEEEFEALIEAAESEKSRLSSSLSTLQSRNSTLASELSKTSSLLAIARSQNIDAKLADHRQEMADINLEIDMLTAS